MWRTTATLVTRIKQQSQKAISFCAISKQIKNSYVEPTLRVLCTTRLFIVAARDQKFVWSLEIVFCSIEAWIQPGHFWLATRFSCCLKMKSVENILGYIQPQENLWNCSRKYTKMFKTYSFLGNKRSSFNQNVWRDHATMQQDVLLHFWVIFLY